MVEMVDASLGLVPVGVWFVGFVVVVVGVMLTLVVAEMVSISHIDIKRWMPVASLVGLVVGGLMLNSAVPRTIENEQVRTAVGDIESTYGLKFSADLMSKDIVPDDGDFRLVSGVVKNDGSVLPMVKVVRADDVLTVYSVGAPEGVEVVELEPVTSD